MHRRDFIRLMGQSTLGMVAASQMGIVLFSQAQQKPLNFVFFLIDDLGWTDLACYNSDLYETPHIDQLAAEGIRFTDAYAACTVCSPTRAAVMTGKYPARLHITDWIHGHKRPKAKLAIPEWTEYLPLEEVTIAEALKQAEYATAHVGKWHLGDTPDLWPDRQGFDLNVAGYGKGQPPSYFYPYKRERGGNREIPTLEGGEEGEYLTDRLTQEAIQFIEQHADGPFYLYFPHYAVHTPLQAKQALIDKYEGKITPEHRHNNATYAGMVESVDDSVGAIMAKLEELGIADHTVIFFTGDNGGLIGGRKRVTTNVPLRAGKGSAYEGGVRVPLIVKWPDVTQPGSECSEPVISVDFYPTLLQMADIPGDAGHNAGLDGMSLVPLLRNPYAKLDRPAIYWHYPHYHPGGATPYGAIRAGDWKLIEFYEDMHVELYNLRVDVSEKVDLADKMPMKVNDLRSRLHAWRGALGAQMPTPNPNYEPKP